MRKMTFKKAKKKLKFW